MSVVTEIEGISDHMLGLARGALQHANWHANYYSMDNRYWSELSVLQAAHACELFIKARIAEEHPLLIFEKIKRPESITTTNDPRDIYAKSRTFAFMDLPDRLWSTTGIKVPNLARYRAFGELRNVIQHFVPSPLIHAAQESLSFIYEVIDPFINACWGLYAIDHNEDHEPHKYLVEGLVQASIRFLPSPDMMSSFETYDFEWPDDPSFKMEMTARFEAAKSTA